MDDLQYNGVLLSDIENMSYVLNLVINGWPSIPLPKG